MTWLLTQQLLIFDLGTNPSERIRKQNGFSQCSHYSWGDQMYFADLRRQRPLCTRYMIYLHRRGPTGTPVSLQMKPPIVS